MPHRRCNSHLVTQMNYTMTLKKYWIFFCDIHVYQYMYMQLVLKPRYILYQHAFCSRLTIMCILTFRATTRFTSECRWAVISLNWLSLLSQHAISVYLNVLDLHLGTSRLYWCRGLCHRLGLGLFLFFFTVYTSSSHIDMTIGILCTTLEFIYSVFSK